MHSFYVDGLLRIGEQASLAGDEAKHACRVLRLKPGDEFIAMDGIKRCRARFYALTEKACQAEVLEELPENESPLRLTVFQGIGKSDKMELITQKLNELGVEALVPVRMARSVAQLQGKERVDRLRKIARESAKQCGRARPMRVEDPVDGRGLSDRLKKFDLAVVPWEEARDLNLQDMRDAYPSIHSLALVIGPEGGMTAEEIAEMESARAKTITLGSRILRMETAAIACAAICAHLWGDLA